MTALETAILRRLTELTKTARMWGSPEELECVAFHFTHVLLCSRNTGWSIEQSFEKWKALGGPFADDPDEHANMRSKLWGEQELKARTQVVEGFLVVWTGLERHPEREAVFGPWIEGLLDFPERAGSPDRLNMTLFALMGFVAADPQKYVAALSLERHRIGGHELRALPVVAPPGPTEAALTYTRNFASWARVTEGIAAVMKDLTQ
ncbi:MAG: hypothetical protein Q8L48_23360 [Archangium sp.]|nr:hypothetical protein [Archangium sp.]